MIAHYIEEDLLPMCDYFFDFHSGGSSLYYPATLLRGLGHSAEESAKLIELQAAFDAPFAWVLPLVADGIQRRAQPWVGATASGP